MSELVAHWAGVTSGIKGFVYYKDEADKVIKELKAYRFLGQDEVWPDANLGSDYYLKSEADKVIADKGAEIAELKKACNDKDDWCLHILKENRHHKYKRCLAMARWCASRSASWCLDPADEQLHKSDFYDKWKKRWLGIAKKFKPNSTAQ